MKKLTSDRNQPYHRVISYEIKVFKSIIRYRQWC